MRHYFRAPFDKLRANGSVFGDRLPWLCTLRQAQGERKRILGDRLPRLFTLRQAQGERKRTLGIVFPGSSPFDRLRANGSALRGSSSPAVRLPPSTGSGRTEAHLGDRLPWLCALRQAQGERKRTLRIVFPGCAPFDRLRANGLRPQGHPPTLSVASPESPSGIAQKPSVALPKRPLRMPLDG